MIEQKRIIVGQEEIFYLFKPSARPVATLVFIHGFPFSSAIWTSQLQSLPENIEGIAYDIGGFGQSSAAHHFFSVDLFARNLNLLLDALKLEKVILCGLSMGGYISLRFAQIYSEKLAGLILCDTNSVADTDESKLKRFASIDLVSSGKKDEFISGFLNNIFAELSFERNTEAVKHVEGIMQHTAAETICAAQLALASRTDTGATLSQLEVPALIVRGEHDKVMTNEHASILQEGIINSEKVIIPGSGHMSNLENESVFNGFLLNFLSKHFF